MRTDRQWPMSTVLTAFAVLGESRSAIRRVQPSFLLTDGDCRRGRIRALTRLVWLSRLPASLSVPRGNG